MQCVCIHLEFPVFGTRSSCIPSSVKCIRTVGFLFSWGSFRHFAKTSLVWQSPMTSGTFRKIPFCGLKLRWKESAAAALLCGSKNRRCGTLNSPGQIHFAAFRRTLQVSHPSLDRVPSVAARGQDTDSKVPPPGCF